MLEINLSTAKKKLPIPVDENVVFLSHFEQSPPINVATGEVSTWLNTGYYSTQPIVNNPADAKFGSGYLKHGGTVGGGASEYVQFPKNFTLGTRDFTIESWHAWSAVFSPSGSGQYGWEIGVDSQYYCGLKLHGSRYNGIISLEINRGYNGAITKTINVSALIGVPETAYFHVAVVREGKILRVYVGGKLIASEDIGTLAIHEGTLVRVGMSNNAYQPACMLDEMRIVVDQALYSGAGFTPPNEPFPDPV